jgi:hypothetical protein
MATVTIEFEDGSKEHIYSVDSLQRVDDKIFVTRIIKGVPATDPHDSRANSITQESESKESLEFPDGVITSIGTKYA